jgi:polar amino acid transport system substrate-binding protein
MKHVLAFLLFLLAASWSFAGAKEDVAPTGVLRATFLGTNPVQAHIDAKTGEITGIVPDLVKALAARLGLPYEIQPAANAADIVKRLAEGRADIGFMAYDEKRAREVDFSDSYALMFNAFVAKADSPIAASAQVDRPGVKIAAVKGQTQEIVLSQTVKQGTMVLLDRKPDAVQLLGSGQADVYAANRHDAELVAQGSGGRLKVLPDNFLAVDQAVVTRRGEPARLAQVNRFIVDVRTDGTVQKAIAGSGISGLAVARETHR